MPSSPSVDRLEVRVEHLESDVDEVKATQILQGSQLSDIKLALAQRAGAISLANAAMAAGAGVFCTVLTLIAQYVMRDPPPDPPKPVVITPEMVEAWRSREARPAQP